MLHASTTHYSGLVRPVECQHCLNIRMHLCFLCRVGDQNKVVYISILFHTFKQGKGFKQIKKIYVLFMAVKCKKYRIIVSCL
ncbi:hypothetical protein DPEC_G00014370 [Dallia pectoralis]|uniref:Uncharacterized protein n=1 Tax=Dallia pectoralis TaxID=75939 RepID=A0ACC2HM59_DALPE|nr:hypothetical protein DPEC_G00014370 [Dallia pectoralis]